MQISRLPVEDDASSCSGKEQKRCTRGELALAFTGHLFALPECRRQEGLVQLGAGPRRYQEECAPIDIHCGQIGGKMNAFECNSQHGAIRCDPSNKGQQNIANHVISRLTRRALSPLLEPILRICDTEGIQRVTRNQNNHIRNTRGFDIVC